MRALLDVNVPIALLDTEHVHHELAMSWLEMDIRHRHIGFILYACGVHLW